MSKKLNEAETIYERVAKLEDEVAALRDEIDFLKDALRNELSQIGRASCRERV